MNILAIIGITGGILCAIADLVLDLKGADNKKLSSIIESNWIKMSQWRFTLSIILAMVAVPMYTCGFWALMNKVSETHNTLSVVMKVIFLCGAMGGFMIHSFICVMPTVYCDIINHDGTKEESKFDLAKKLTDDIFSKIFIPFTFLYILLVIVPAIVVVAMIIMGILPLSIWTVLLNPVVFQIIGLLLKGTKIKAFIDAPSCCAASLGLACYGALALMLA